MVLLLKFFSWFHAAVPVRVSVALGGLTGWMMYVLLSGKRRVVRTSLHECFPEWSESKVQEITRAVFRNQGWLLAETFRRIGKPRRDPLDDIRYDPNDMAAFDEIYRKYKGALVLTAHINNYEYLQAWAARFYPMSIAAKPIKPKALGDFVQKMRKDAGICELPHHGSYRNLLRAVKDGGCIGFILDQNMKRREGVFVTFFGKPASTSAGLAMLSAHAHVPVVPVFILRDGGHYRIKLYPPILPPVDRSIEMLHATTQQYSNVMEDVIREQPESWIWMHKRWKTAPMAGDRITLPDGSVKYA